MRVVLYRPTLSLTSGAGQLIEMQARALMAAGADVEVAAARGSLKFFLRTGIRARRRSERLMQSADGARRYADVLVDHGAVLAHADLTFVHNLFSAASRFVEREDWRLRAAAERRLFDALAPAARVVANSRLVASALVEGFGLNPARIEVLYPGYRSAVFHRGAVPELRKRERRLLGIDDRTPVAGLVTSGDFRKRGLDIFLEAATQIAARRPDTRFIVVGSHRLPESARGHALVRSGRLVYRPKDRHPERRLAVLDVLVYPARFEEFGMVVAEAQALGVAVLTSRRVGAAECLPPAYGPWLATEPDAGWFAERTLALLGDDRARAALTEAAVASVQAFGEDSYVRAAIRAILAQKR